MGPGLLIGMGVIIGCVLIAIVSRICATGTIRVDSSDPYDGPYLFLELERDVRAITSKKYVTFKVKVENYISQK